VFFASLGVQVDALCFVMGYEEGIVVAESHSKLCPESYATSVDGKAWTSDLVNSSGVGAQFKCVKLRAGYFMTPAVGPTTTVMVTTTPAPVVRGVERCQSVGDFTIWDRAARGLDLRNYTGNTLQFIGASADGAAVTSFYCRYDAVTDKLSFGIDRYVCSVLAVALHWWSREATGGRTGPVGKVCGEVCVVGKSS
jgi:hypothetical protein